MSQDRTRANDVTSTRHARAGALPAFCALALVVLAGAAIRLAGSLDEFWLDEIWTLRAFVVAPHSYLDILTFHHDNNHYLNTLWMDLLGPAVRPWFWYRLPALIAGVGTILLAARIARRWGARASIATALLTAVSFVMVVYSSEARGYALAGFCSLLAWMALDRYLTRGNVAAAALFAATVWLGTLAHLTFVQFYAGAVAWSAVRIWRESATARQAATRLLVLHALPVCGLAMLYFIDVRHIHVGGGDAYVLPEVIEKTLALAVGVATENTALRRLAAAVAAGVSLWAIVDLVRQKGDLWLFFAVGFVVAPALLLVVQQPVLLYERYFFLNLLYFQILLGYGFSRMVAHGGVPRAVGVTALALVVGGNLFLDWGFLRDGRGHYLEALEYIAAHTPPGPLSLGGDDDFDNHTYLGYYIDFLPGKRSVNYTNVARLPAGAQADPAWIMLHSQARPYEPLPEITLPGTVGSYALERVYPCGRLSGYQFALYRRMK